MRLPKLPILTLVGAALLAAPAFAANGDLASVHRNATGLSFDALVQHGGGTLSVTGPNGFAVSMDFAAGEDPSFSIFDQAGAPLADGAYTFEARFFPLLGNAAKAARVRRDGVEGNSAALGSRDEMEPVSGYFTIDNGVLVGGLREKDEGLTAAPQPAVAGALEGTNAADQQILDDLIVVGSICAGQDCNNGESFGFDTLRLKENNLRIRAQDTSTSASFPTRDWQITFNDSSNGGANKFSIDDIDGGRTPFTIEAGAPSHSLYVEDGGRLGLGTSTPVADIHVKSGNTPTLRLEQDGTSGFGAQTWDLAGNEANFFIRDATNGSTLPFRIFPSAPSNALTIEGTTGDIGMGTTSPTAELHISGSSQPEIRITNTSHTATAPNTNTWRLFYADDGAFGISVDQSGDREMEIDQDGNMTIPGDYFSVTCAATPAPGTPCAPDYVFEADYELLPMDELKAFIEKEKHLPNIPSAEELVGPINISQMQMKLLEKIEELTLYTLSQQEHIERLDAQNADLIDQVRQLLEEK